MSKEGTTGGDTFYKRNHSGQQWSRPEILSAALVKYKQKVLSLDEHQGDPHSRNKVKNSLVVRSTQKPTSKLLSSASKGGSKKMFSVVKGVKQSQNVIALVPSHKNKLGTPIHLKATSPQQFRHH